MKVVWHIARYEFKMQRRGLVFWLVALVLLAFWAVEVRPSIAQSAYTAVSPTPVWELIAGGGRIDAAAELQSALAVAPFSRYMAWHFADRIGLVAALFTGFLGVFVWQRDRRWHMEDVIHSRAVQPWQYAGGKYLGVVLTWGSILAPLAALQIGSTYLLARQLGLPFAWSDFAAPLFAWMGVTLLYATALVLLLSLLLRNSAGTLLLYFFYWGYAIVAYTMFQSAGTVQFLTYWLFRFDYGSSVTAYRIFQQRQPDVWLNRLLYAGLAMALVGLLVVAWQRLRERGVFLAPRRPMINEYVARVTHLRQASKLRALRYFSGSTIANGRFWRLPIPTTRENKGKVENKTTATLTFIHYQARLFPRRNLWLAPLLALLLPGFIYFPPGSEAARVYWALRMNETFMPLTGIILIAHLLSQEWEGGTADLWLVRAGSRIKLLLARLLLAALFLIAVLVLPFGVLYLTYVTFSWQEMFLVVLPPALFLGVLGMVSGLLSKSSALAFLVPLIYWFFEMTTKGVYTGPLYLFARTVYPCQDTAENCFRMFGNLPWLGNKAWLTLATLGLVLLAAGWLRRTGKAWRPR